LANIPFPFNLRQHSHAVYRFKFSLNSIAHINPFPLTSLIISDFIDFKPYKKKFPNSNEFSINFSFLRTSKDAIAMEHAKGLPP
jgi:hypothetical protein